MNVIELHHLKSEQIKPTRDEEITYQIFEKLTMRFSPWHDDAVPAAQQEEEDDIAQLQARLVPALVRPNTAGLWKEPGIFYLKIIGNIIYVDMFKNENAASNQWDCLEHFPKITRPK